MAINALLSPAVVPTTAAEGGTPSATAKPGDGFAGLFAQTMGSTTNATPIAEPPVIPGAQDATVAMPIAALVPVGSDAKPEAVVPANAESTPLPAVVSTPPSSVVPQAVLAEPSAMAPLEEPVLPAIAAPKSEPLQAPKASPPAEASEMTPDEREAISAAAPKVPEGTGETAPEEKGPPVESLDLTEARPVRNQAQAFLRSVDAPPDPPPVEAPPRKGAPTKAPTAPVERLDPNPDESDSKTEKSTVGAEDAGPVERPVVAAIPVALPTPTPLVTDRPSTAPTANAFTPGRELPQAANVTSVPTVAAPAASSPKVDKAPAKGSTRAARSEPKPVASTAAKLPIAGVDEDSSLAAPASEAQYSEAVLTVAEPKGQVAAPATFGTTDAKPSADAETQAAPADLPNARPALPNAPDLRATPQVVSVATTAVTQAGPAPRNVPHAEIAKLAVERPAVKSVDAPKAPAITEETASTMAVPFEAASGAGSDTPSEDTPERDAMPSPTPEAPAPSAARTAATERPETGTDRPSVDRHLVVRQVADRIENLVASRPKDGVVVHLEPRDLGTVTLVVKGIQSALDVQVTASDERVRQSLNASRPELAQALAPRGIELRELRVATGAPSSASSSSSTGGTPNGGSSNGGNPNPDGRSRSQNPASSFARSSRAETATPRAVRSRSGGRGVDLLV